MAESEEALQLKRRARRRLVGAIALVTFVVIILPLILDQYHNAHRLHVAGLVPRPIAMEKITPAELTQSIRTALALAAQPRQLAAQRLRDSNGCGDIVDRVEALVIGRRRSG